MKSFLVVLFFVSSAYADALVVKNPSPFEYIHCVAGDVNSKEIVPHYVIDLRQSDNHKLFWQVALANKKAKSLKNLNFIGAQLKQNVDLNSDVSWQTDKDLVISLNIIDNDGYALEGKMVNGSAQKTLNCKDASQE